MVGGPGKSWKSVNSSSKVFLKDIKEQPDGKIQQLKKYFMWVLEKTFWDLKKSWKFVSGKRVRTLFLWFNFQGFVKVLNVILYPESLGSLASG